MPAEVDRRGEPCRGLVVVVLGEGRELGPALGAFQEQCFAVLDAAETGDEGKEMTRAVERRSSREGGSRHPSSRAVARVDTHLRELHRGTSRAIASGASGDLPQVLSAITGVVIVGVAAWDVIDGFRKAHRP